MKTGVFLCTCGSTVDIDFKKLRKSTIADAVEVHDFLCRDEGLAKISEAFKRYGLGHALVGCTSRRHEFESIGLSLQFLNLREHCGWVHSRKEATEKAALMVNAALKCPPSTKKLVIDAGWDVLIAGEPSAAMRIAHRLSKALNVHVLSADAFPSDVPMETAGRIKIHAASVKNIEGRLGKFQVNIIDNPIDTENCISCGKCLEACPIHAISDYPVFAVTKGCNSCGKCLEVCPVHAIDLEEKRKTIKAGQILAIGEDIPHLQRKTGIYVTEAGKTAEETVKQALPAAVEIMSNMGSIEREKQLTVSLEGCASGKSGLAGCRLCDSICQYGAISRSGDKMVFDEVSCRGCGACSSVCPRSLPGMEYDIYSMMEHLLRGSGSSKKILMFACARCTPLLDAAGRRKMKYPPVLPLFIPCLMGVSETHILRAFDLGADGVILLGCRDCGYGNIIEEASRLAGIILKEFNLDERIRIIKNNDGAAGFVEAVTGFSRQLAPSPLKSRMPVIFKRQIKRDIMLDLMAGFAAKTGIVPRISLENTEHPFADVSINSKCTVCGACTAMCPTGALVRENGSIRFIYGCCIACGLCEKACPETALKLHRALHLEKLIDTPPQLLIESEQQYCAACKKPYMTAAAYDRIAGSLIVNVRDDLTAQEQLELIRSQIELLKYCEKCRPAKAIMKMEIFS